MEVTNIQITDISVDLITVCYDNKPVSGYFLEVLTNKGISGFYGPIRQPAVAVLLLMIKDTVIGLNPTATENVWNKVWAVQFGGRTGIWMMAMGALDCALWDIRGKVFQVPVYELLGGSCRMKVPCYASCLGFDEEKDVPERVNQIEKQGFLAQKWALRSDSISKDIQNAKRICESTSDQVMFEILGKWNIQQTKQFCNALASYSNIGWIEEPIPSEMLLTCANHLRNILIPIAAGEHIYNRYEAHSLLVENIVDFLQLDIGWCGGITEGIRIAALSSTVGIPIIPHGHNFLPGLHLAFAYPPDIVPMLEYHITLEPRRQCFYKCPIKPIGGSISPPSDIGLGTELTPHILKRERLKRPELPI